MERHNCTVGANQEELFQVECTHVDLCRLDVRSSVYSTIRHAIQTILDQAENKMLQMTDSEVHKFTQTRVMLTLAKHTYQADWLP